MNLSWFVSAFKPESEGKKKKARLQTNTMVRDTKQNAEKEKSYEMANSSGKVRASI